MRIRTEDLAPSPRHPDSYENLVLLCAADSEIVTGERARATRRTCCWA
ncbi:hypothetical protein [Lentzea guizhouensis]|nr:hypothetical protein [Lentzea guizhouensis]